MTANTNVITMGQLENINNHTTESETIKEIMNIDQFQYNHVLEIFRFLHTMFYNRLTQGADGAMEVVKCMINIAEASGCRTLVLIARTSLCEVYLINDDFEKLCEEISQIEMIMVMLGIVENRVSRIPRTFFVVKYDFFVKNNFLLKIDFLPT